MSEAHGAPKRNPILRAPRVKSPWRRRLSREQQVSVYLLPPTLSGTRQPFVRNGPLGFLTNRVGEDNVAINSMKSIITTSRNRLTLCVYAICQGRNVEP